jgi:hypothetical protein
MAHWLKLFLIIFVAVNALAFVANLPNPITLFIAAGNNPNPGQRSLEGGLAALSGVMAVAMLIGWAVIALVMWLTMGRRPA